MIIQSMTFSNVRLEWRHEKDTLEILQRCAGITLEQILSREVNHATLC